LIVVSAPRAWKRGPEAPRMSPSAPSPNRIRQTSIQHPVGREILPLGTLTDLTHRERQRRSKIVCNGARLCESQDTHASSASPNHRSCG
jgi:hypothetical protein